MAVNHMTFQGRIVKDIEKKITQSGISNTTFTLAWSEKYKEIERSCFQKCKAWRGTADFLDKYMHDKGTEMVVEGNMITEKWQDKDGNNRSENILYVDKVHFCGKKQSGQGNSGTAPEGAKPDGTFVKVEGTELPF